MSSKFIKLMLSTFSFPKDVFPEVVKVFGSRYSSDLGKNPALGGHGRVLVRECLRDHRWGALIEMIYSGNPYVLDEILVSGTSIPFQVFNTIDAVWSLAPTDQLRLVSLGLDEGTAHHIVHSRGFAPSAREAAALMLKRPDLVGTFDDDFVEIDGERVHTWSEKTELRESFRSDSWPKSISSWTPRDVDMENTIDYYAESGFASLNFLGLSVEEILGYGCDEMSLRSWILLLSLSGSSGEISLEKVLCTAKRLAFSEM
jgi:hypothetical protein